MLGPAQTGHIARLEFKRRLERDSEAREAFQKQLREEKERRQALRQVKNLLFFLEIILICDLQLYRLILVVWVLLV